MAKFQVKHTFDSIKSSLISTAYFTMTDMKKIHKTSTRISPWNGYQSCVKKSMCKCFISSNEELEVGGNLHNCELEIYKSTSTRVYMFLKKTFISMNLKPELLFLLYWLAMYVLVRSHITWQAIHTNQTNVAKRWYHFVGLYLLSLLIDVCEVIYKICMFTLYWHTYYSFLYNT